MVSAEALSKRACPYLGRLVERAKKKITLKYGQCVGLRVVLVSKLVSVSEK